MIPCSEKSRFIFTTSYQIGSTAFSSEPNFVQYFFPSFSDTSYKQLVTTPHQQYIISNLYNYIHRQIVEDQYIYAYSKWVAKINPLFKNKTIKFAKDSEDCQDLLRGLEVYTGCSTLGLENELKKSPSYFKEIKNDYYNLANEKIYNGWLTEVLKQLKP